MVGKEGMIGGGLEKFKNFSETSRNVAVGVAVVGAFVAPPLVIPALLWAGTDQLQIMGTEYIQNWRKK